MLGAVHRLASSIKHMLRRCCHAVSRTPPVQAGLRVGRHVAFETLPRLIAALYYWAGALAGIANGLANAALCAPDAGRFIQQ